MNTIELMLRALKNSSPDHDCPTCRGLHFDSIAAGEAELRREPDAWQYLDFAGEWVTCSHEIADYAQDQTGRAVRQLMIREEIK